MECHYQCCGITECFPADHELLSRRGWISVADVALDDEIATFNPEKNVVEYQKPTRVHNYSYNGDLVKIKTDRVDLLVTPNHRMIVKKKTSGMRAPYDEAKWVEYTAEELLNPIGKLIPVSTNGIFSREKNKKAIFIPKTEYGSTGNKGNEPTGDGYYVEDIELLAEFCGLMASEGWLGNGNQYDCSVNFGQAVVHQDVIDRWKYIISQLPFREWRTSVSMGKRRNGEKTCEVITWTNSNKTLNRWIEEQTGKGFDKKHIPDFVLQSDSQDVQASFFRGMMAGDGHVYHDDCYGIRSGSQQMVNDLQALGVHLRLYDKCDGNR